VENDLMKKPGHIFSVDETSLQLNHKPGYVIAKRNSKDVHLLTSVEKEETTSFIHCYRAEGYVLPRVYIFIIF
jgi:hypothetical protein